MYDLQQTASPKLGHGFLICEMKGVDAMIKISS